MGKIANATVWRTRRRRCHWCNVKLLPETASRDHVMPRAVVGGALGRPNVVLSCYPCNGAKGAQTPEEFEESEWLQRRRLDVQFGRINRTMLPTAETYRKRDYQPVRGAV